MVTKQLFFGDSMNDDIFVGDAADFRERVIWVIRHFAGRPPRYKHLEDRFEISARKWQNVCNRAQQPSIEMVAALATVYPYFVHWMVTGEAHTVRQLDPSDKSWFKVLIDSLTPDAQKLVLENYADRLCERVTGLPPVESK